MSKYTILASLLGGAVLAFTTSAAQAQETSFDNPGTETGPCVALNDYEVQRTTGAEGATAFRGTAVLENICGRAMEVKFCFRLAEPVDDKSENCFEGSIRPWDSVNVIDPAAGARIVGANYEWRYLPVDTTS